MDIFKLFFEHDLRLDDLADRSTGNEPRTELSIEDFMKPDPTYSKFYLTGTRLEEDKFGLNVLSRYPGIIKRLSSVFHEYHFRAPGSETDSFEDILDITDIGDPILISAQDVSSISIDNISVDYSSNVGHIKTEIREILKNDILLLYKEQAHHGFDLHLFSKENIYPSLFESLKELVGEHFRFFSINNKRIRSERQFYFETWTLEKPPHGVEEVFRETAL